MCRCADVQVVLPGTRYRVPGILCITVQVVKSLVELSYYEYMGFNLIERIYVEGNLVAGKGRPYVMNEHHASEGTIHTTHQTLPVNMPTSSSPFCIQHRLPLFQHPTNAERRYHSSCLLAGVPGKRYMRDKNRFLRALHLPTIAYGSPTLNNARSKRQIFWSVKACCRPITQQIATSTALGGIDTITPSRRTFAVMCATHPKRTRTLLPLWSPLPPTLTISRIAIKTCAAPVGG